MLHCLSFVHYARPNVYTCSRCICSTPSRSFSRLAALQSGHNRWSKIRHDKAKNDLGKNKQRNLLASEIATSSKLFGPDPNANPRLAAAVARGKKEGFPKASIEAAIARGQGISASGAKLESVIVEAIVPPSIALVIDSQTDSKLRTLNDIRTIISKHSGQVTSTGYLFDKKGEIVFKAKKGVGMDEILDAAAEAGALDIEEGFDGQLVVYSEPNITKAVADKLVKDFGLEIESSEIIWDPNTEAALDSGNSAANLIAMIDKLREIPAVQGVYLNAAQGAAPEELWDQLQSRVFAP